MEDNINVPKFEDTKEPTVKPTIEAKTTTIEPTKKKMSKTTTIILIVVLLIVAAVIGYFAGRWVFELINGPIAK